MSLTELEERLDLLTRIRNAKVETGRTMIERANLEYDREVLPLAREIARLRKALKTPAPALPKQRVRTAKQPPVDPDWSDADRQHFLELAGRNGKS